MVGRASLMVIMGFSLIFGVAGQYWNRTSNRAVENMWNYYDSTAAHELALSAAYILADTIFWCQNNAAYMGHLNFPNRSFGTNATYSMSTQPDTVDGDSCILATVKGTYVSTLGRNINDTVQILLKPGRFCQYAFFTNDDNGVYWQTGDTMKGPYHTNTRLCIDGTPDFTQSVSTGTGLTAYNNNHPINPILPTQLPDAGGDKLICPSYQSGVIINMPSSLASFNSIPATTVISSSDTHSNYAYDVYFTFNPSGGSGPGQVGFHTQLSTVSGTTVTAVSGGRIPASGDSIVDLSSFGNAGGQGLGSVVIVKNGDVHVTGQMDGKVTFVAEQTNTSAGDVTRVSTNALYNSTSGNFDCYGANGNHSNGNVIIEGNTTYQNTSTDELGLVADNSIMVRTSGRSLTSSSVTNIDGALFARQGKIFAQNYGNGSAMGKLNVLGALAQNVRGPVGLVGGSSGFSKYYTFDQRFARTLTSPPYSPSTGSYNILSWLE